MRGWNVCTDLYRVLEHVYDNLRADPAGNDENAPGHAVTAFLSQRRVDSHAALRLVERLLGELPPELRRVNAMTGDTGADRLGFIGTLPRLAAIDSSDEHHHHITETQNAHRT